LSLAYRACFSPFSSLFLDSPLIYLQPIPYNRVNPISKQIKEYIMSQNTYSPYGDSPGLVKTIAVMTLVNGIVNILWGLGVTAGVVLGTFFIGLICAPITILPTILGIFEMIYALKLLANPPQPVQPSTSIAILEILCVLAGNVFSMIVGILALVFYNDPQVKEYFANLNRIPYPVAPVPPVPPAAPDPESFPEQAPVIEAEPPAEAPSEVPAAPKPKKKPGTRKVAAEKKDAPSQKDASSKAEKPKQKPKSGNSSS
jgi:hypothetical protein